MPPKAIFWCATSRCSVGKTHGEQARPPGAELCLRLRFWRSCLFLCKERWGEAGRGVGGERGGQEQVRAREMGEEPKMERAGPRVKHRGSTRKDLCRWRALGLVPLLILGTACPCRHLGRNGVPPHLSQPCHLLSWAPQIQPTWDSPRAWPLSLSPSVLTPSPTSCTVPCWGRTPFNSPCPPAPATPRHAAPNRAPPGGHRPVAGAGTSGAGHAGASGDGALGGPSSQRRAGQGALGLAPGPRP